MFKRFTPNCTPVVLIATEEARGLGHGDIAPEHLLLGALRSGGASQFALAQLGLREGAIRARIGMRLPRGDARAGDATLAVGATPSGRLPPPCGCRREQRRHRSSSPTS